MKLSNVFLVFPASVLVAFASGCAHEAPRVATLETTSASMTRAPDPAVAAIQAEPRDAKNVAEAGDARTGVPFVPEVEKVDVPYGAPIEQWSQRYPDASKQLADWIQHYPSTAAKLAEWSAAHPIRMRALITWAAAHRFESLDAFMYGRSGWNDVRTIRHDDPDGMSELLDWIRRSPSAATDLATHADALAWASDHVKAPNGNLASSQHSTMPQAPPKTDNDENASPWTPSMSSLVR